MSRTKDFTGRSFNRWSVISRAANRAQKAFWLCKCQCGTIKEVRSSYLTNNHSKNCGCVSDEPDAITAEDVRRRLHYDPETGIFTWKVGPYAGQRAGGMKGSQGYVQIKFRALGCLGHRLAWLYIHGEWPTQLIDHINGARTDNRIANLRLSSPSMNRQNMRRPSKNSTTGFLGVSHRGEMFTAQIRHDGKTIYLGLFETAEDAHGAYVAAKRIHHEGCTL